MAELDDLDAELQALGRTLVVDAPADDLVGAGARPAAGRTEPMRTRPGGGRAAGGLVAVIVALVILGLGLTPPVRAAVVEWLRIGGVLIRPRRRSPARHRPRPPPTTGARDPGRGQALVDFPVGVPASWARLTG